MLGDSILQFAVECERRLAKQTFYFCWKKKKDFSFQLCLKKRKSSGAITEIEFKWTPFDWLLDLWTVQTERKVNLVTFCVCAELEKATEPIIWLSAACTFATRQGWICSFCDVLKKKAHNKVVYCLCGAEWVREKERRKTIFAYEIAFWNSQVANNPRCIISRSAHGQLFFFAI